MSDTKKEFANRLKTLRLSKNLQQKQLADLLGLKDERNYRQYEAGEIDISASKLALLADYFDVSTDYLLGRTNARQPITDEKLNSILLPLLEEIKNNYNESVEKIVEVNKFLQDFEAASEKRVAEMQKIDSLH